MPRSPYNHCRNCGSRVVFVKMPSGSPKPFGCIDETNYRPGLDTHYDKNRHIFHSKTCPKKPQKQAPDAAPEKLTLEARVANLEASITRLLQMLNS